MKKPGPFPLTHNNQVELLYDGSQFINSYLQSISEAKKFIFIQTYIFDLDEFGQNVYQEIISARLRGVEIFLLIDDFGSKNFNDIYGEKLTKHGIHFCRFNPINFNSKYPLKRRLHHKLLLVDGVFAIIGGINIVYPFEQNSAEPRLDFAVKIIGPALDELSRYAFKTFQKASHQKNLPKIYWPPTQHFKQGHTLKISVNDWFLGRYFISLQYKKLIFSAKNQITLLNSYFFPRKKLRNSLVLAKKRGVRVRLILPKNSDWKSYVWASEYLYVFFLKNGIEIYQWDQSIMHGKLATIDDSICTIGSFNLNYTSFQQNLEMNVDIYSKQFTQFINNEIDHHIIPKCLKIESEQFMIKTNFFLKLRRFFFYLLFSWSSRFLENHSSNMSLDKNNSLNGFR